MILPRCPTSAHRRRPGRSRSGSRRAAASEYGEGERVLLGVCFRRKSIMTNSSTSDDKTGQDAPTLGGSLNPRRQATGAQRKPRVQRVAGLGAAATSQVKGAGGAVHRTSAATAERGRAAGARAAATAGRAATDAATGAAVPGRAAREQAVSGVGRASGGVAARGRSAGNQVGRAASSVAETAARDVTQGAASVSDTGHHAVGRVVSTTTEVGKVAAGAVGSAVRIGAGMSLSFLIGKALLLLELIKRLCVATLDALSSLAGRLQERLSWPEQVRGRHRFLMTAGGHPILCTPTDHHRRSRECHPAAS
jgi:hypothetical protein